MDFSSINPASSNALSWAARINDVKNVARLLKKLNPNCVDNRGWTCLHEAAYNDNYESMMLILKNPRTRGLAETHEGHTALYLACKNKCSLKTIKALLDLVKDIANYCSTEGVTPLHIASFHGNVEMVELLLEYGADINVQDFDGDTPLHDAALEGQHSTLVTLLYAGAEPEIRNCPENYTPFHIACCKGYFPNVASLFPFVTDINECTSLGDTALHFALKVGSEDILYFLLDNGADPNVKNHSGQMPIDMTLTMSASVFKKLLEITDRDLISKDLVINACQPVQFKFEILEAVLSSDLGPEFFNVTKLFPSDTMHVCAKYIAHAPLNNFLSISGYIYNISPEKFKEFFYLYLMKGVNVNPIQAIECPPLVYAHYIPLVVDNIRGIECFNEIFQLLIEHGCDVDYSNAGKSMGDDVCISDAFLTALESYPDSALLMMPYSLYNEPDKYLQLAIEKNLIAAMPLQVQSELMGMIDKNFTKIPPELLDFQVRSLKHLCRYTIRRFFRNKSRENFFRANSISVEFTTSGFLNIINDLPVPHMIKNYIRYIEN